MKLETPLRLEEQFEISAEEGVVHEDAENVSVVGLLDQTSGADGPGHDVEEGIDSSKRRERLQQLFATQDSPGPE